MTSSADPILTPRRDTPGRPAPVGPAPAGVVLGLVLAAVASAVFVDASGWTWVAGLLATIGLGVGWPILVVHWARLTLDVPTPLADEGRPLALELRVDRPRWAVLRCGLELSIDGHTLALDAVAARRVVPLTFTPGRRGPFPRGDAVLRCSFPFGLFTASRRVVPRRRTLVRPAPVPVAEAPGAPADGSGRGRLARLASSGELIGTRDYRRGDSPRQIDWAATARMDRLIAQQRAEPTHDAVTVIIDDASFASPNEHPTDDAYEWAIRAAAGMTVHWCAAATNLTLHVAGRTYRAGSAAGAERLLEALAALPERPSERRRAMAAPDDGVTVVLTTRPTTDFRGAAAVLRMTRGRLPHDGPPAPDAATIASVAGLRRAMTNLGRKRGRA